MSFKSLFDRFNAISKIKFEFDLKNIPPVAYQVKTQMDAHLSKAFELLKTIRA
jgi:hypothetical protein